jgi:hypothetical protein
MTSLGRGIGQQTGGDEWADALEFKRLLKMIVDGCKKSDMQQTLDAKSMQFLEEQVERANSIVTHFRVTGKQLFWLRDIKDKLVERGLI